VPFLNIAQALEHCRVLGIPPERALVRAIHWNLAKVQQKAIDLPQALTETMQESMERLQRQGYRLYLIAGRARKDADVTSIPAVFAEWDGWLGEDVDAWLHEQQVAEHGLPEPTLRLRTWEHGSHHVWWRLKEPCTDIERWRRLMKRLVAALGSDPACVNPSRLMRLAGSSYIVKPDGEDPDGEGPGKVIGQARILDANEEAVTTIEELEAWVDAQFAARPELATVVKEDDAARSRGAKAWSPPSDAERLKGTRKKSLLPPRPLEEIRAALEVIPPRVRGTGGPYAWPYHKNVVTGLRDALYRLTSGEEKERIAEANRQAVELVKEAGLIGEDHWDPAETLRSAYWLNEGCFWSRAMALGWTGRRVEVIDEEDREAASLAASEHMANIDSCLDLASVLPPKLAQLLTSRAAAFPVHPSVFIGTLLATVASTIGTRGRIVVKSGWEEAFVIWTAVVLRSGGLKSPTGKIFSDPLSHLQFEAFESHRAAVKLCGSDANAVAELLPARRRLVSDATYERIVQIVGEPTTYGLLSYQDELPQWFAMLDQRANSQARAGWLSFWNGGPALIDRKTAESSFAKHTAVSLCGNVQLEKFRAMVEAAGADPTKAGDGLWTRFLLVCPPSAPWRYTDSAVCINEEITDLICKIDKAPTDLRVQLSPQAIEVGRAQWDAWGQEETRSDPAQASTLSKMRGYSVRIAGILHLLDCAEKGDAWPTDLGAGVMERALILSRFFLSQFRAIQTEMGAGDLSEVVAAFLRKVKETGAQQVSPRDALAWRLWGRAKKTSADTRNLLRSVAEVYGHGEFVQGARKDSWIWRAKG
jgi:hypothetical protein